MRRTRTRAAALALAVAAATVGTTAAATGVASAQGRDGGGTAGCRLGAGNAAVKHVIYLQFDNVHFTRDNPNVPSDLEQMPHLLNFLESQGTLDDNHHTPLIAHTGTDILTSLTGLYGDKHGMPIANSYRYFDQNGVSQPAGTFAYWTDGVYDFNNPNPTDTAPTMVGQDGKTTPAPWTAYTRAGCDFGAVATANTILENTGPDVPKVFGANSPEAAEAADKTNSNLAQTDFVGIGVHCAKTSKLCAAAGANARPDVLPDEPGGYTGYSGLFGAKYTDPAISPRGPVTDVSGATTIADALGRPGFPGFDGMSAANSLGYIAQMQEAGVPVTYGYISDAHDNHAPGGHAYGPGEAGYVAALKSYDTAFDQFFHRLSKDGINASNTMFVVTADENDHFVGGTPSPATCDGVTTPCTYTQLGELNANVKGLLTTQTGDSTSYGIHADSAPNFWVAGAPAANAPQVRTFEHHLDGLTADNPLTGRTETFADYFADSTEMKLLHMETADPKRNPTLTEFANPNYYVFSGAPNCTTPCITEPNGFAWNHGDFAPDINTTWAGFVGPSFKKLGVTDTVWSDHTDLRPTMLTALGLRDTYVHDGVPLVQFIKDNALPSGLHGKKIEELEATYKQLDASVGAFGTDTLKAATAGIKSDTPNDQQFTATEAALTKLGTDRDALASRIATAIDDAAFHGCGLSGGRAHELVREAKGVLGRAHTLAG
ncbi:hypothetical protein GCM10009839_67670 [Catenulispora yoronensis]|uniref:Phosphoesterase n=1 Tax=Catenulispora yoronensis TaxID=450799 RepID=A0ABN2V482_9ACTN